MHADDPKLIQRCLAGDQSAWDELVQRYSRLVYSIPRRYRLRDSDAADVFQGVFAQLFRRLEFLRDPTRLSSWLITAAHRESWRVARKSDRYTDLETMFPDVSSPADEDVELWERQHLVHAALAELGGRCEELIRALFMSGQEVTYDDLSAQLGMPIGSIGPTRARCFAKLEALLRTRGLDG